MKRTTKHLALGAAVLGGAYCLWKRHENPAWTPWASLLSSARDRALALEKVKVTSVPTPHETAALDPGMSTDQVKQVNASLLNETDMRKLANHAVALGALGHDNSAAAVAAKTVAVAEAKAQGAKDVDLHVKQVEAAAVPIPPGAVATGFARGFERGRGWGHGWGRGWGRGGWERRNEPWVDPLIDPATGLPWAEEAAAVPAAPVAVGWDRFARGREGLFGHGRHDLGRGFGRDPRFPRDRFARHEPWADPLLAEPWRHHHHRRHPFEMAPQEVVPQPYAVPQPVAQHPLAQQQAAVADDGGAAADADAGDDAGATATGWW